MGYKGNGAPPCLWQWDAGMRRPVGRRIPALMALAFVLVGAVLFFFAALAGPLLFNSVAKPQHVQAFRLERSRNHETHRHSRFSRGRSRVAACLRIPQRWQAAF